MGSLLPLFVFQKSTFDESSPSKSAALMEMPDEQLPQTLAWQTLS